MMKHNGQLVFSPSDLCTFLESEFASWMDRFRLEFPNSGIERDVDDPLNVTLQQRGLDHERRILDDLKAKGLTVATIENTRDLVASGQATVDALQSGIDVVYQARLTEMPFSGLSDFLVRASGDSALGSYHYEVWDTKLSGTMKPYFLIQLCAYAASLERIQGRLPGHVVIVLGNGDKRTCRTVDYFYYYKCLVRAFLDFHQHFDPNNKPDPGHYKNSGAWSLHATAILNERDSLYRVARISRNQARNIEAAGICTLSDLAQSNLQHVPHTKPEVFLRLKAQAGLQLQSRGQPAPQFAVLPHDPTRRHGLVALPPASPMDIFFDMEGFPLVDGGLEYLWGASYREGGELQFRAYWAHDRREEQQALENFIDWVHERWCENPAMHVYHYASYEVTAVRRLSGRFGSREGKVDDLLRNEVFVDLFAVIRHGMMIGDESYSIKKVERIYRGKRAEDVADAGTSVVYYDAWLKSRDDALLSAIYDYNRADCDSTLELADWLRSVQIAYGIEWLAPVRRTGEDETTRTEVAQETERRRAQLMGLAESSPELSTLAWLIDFHRRENKPQWWRLFDRLKMDEDELFDDLECLAGLERTDAPPQPIARSFVHEFRFDPAQETKLAPGRTCVPVHDENQKFTIFALDAERGIVQVKCGPKVALPNRMSLVPWDYLDPKGLVAGIARYADARIRSATNSRAVDDFLARRPPRIKDSGGGPILRPGESLLAGTTRAILNLDGSTLCIQGPPGAGKSFTASWVIRALIQGGHRVGITSNSHKAINNLLAGTVQRLKETGVECRTVKIGGDADDPLLPPESIHCASASALVPTPDLKLIGGTAFAFAHDKMVGQLDYLFVDEAGQVSIANLVAMHGAARNIVLMGDQMQLGQPIQGSHPGESGLSLLDYLLQGHATIPAELGIFLPDTYRLHPKICQFISEMVYDGRLATAAGTEKQEILQRPELNRMPRSTKNGKSQRSITSGIAFVPVAHEGNAQSSDEEIEAIVQLTSDLLSRRFVDKSGVARDMTWNDILFVAPYNLQVRKLQSALGSHARVGSVDKFQGQEAPVVVLSMCASAVDASAARGIEFLFSKNRLNVAITRAQALAIIVANQQLARTQVASIEQMTQVNFFCRLLDFAEAIFPVEIDPRVVVNAGRCSSET